MDAPSGFAGVYARADEGMQVAVPPPLVIPCTRGLPIDPHDVAAKTPISLLQEACLRKSITPIYELLSTEGQVHEPTFIYRVKVKDMVGTGQGKSKKVAKHLAAKGILDQIVVSGEHVDWAIPGRTQQEAFDYLNELLPEMKKPASVAPGGKETVPEEVTEGGGGMENPIGKLQEMCTKNRWPQPEYELVEEQGQPHERTFIVIARLGNVEQRGEAKSKKQAKRLAAEKMVLFLRSAPSDGYEVDEEALVQNDDPGSAYPPDLEEQLRSLKIEEKEESETPDAGRTAKYSRKDFEALSGEELCGLGAAVKQMLEDVCLEVDKIAPTYYPLPRRAKNGECQCLVQLSTMPVAVCYGSGRTEREAECNAARNALEYLKITVNTNAIPT